MLRISSSSLRSHLAHYFWFPLEDVSSVDNFDSLDIIIRCKMRYCFGRDERNVSSIAGGSSVRFPCQICNDTALGVEGRVVYQKRFLTLGPYSILTLRTAVIKMLRACRQFLTFLSLLLYGQRERSENDLERCCLVKDDWVFG